MTSAVVKVSLDVPGPRRDGRFSVKKNYRFGDGSKMTETTVKAARVPLAQDGLVLNKRTTDVWNGELGT